MAHAQSFQYEDVEADDNKPQAPFCNGKNEGDEMWVDDVLWRWNGYIWKIIFTSLRQPLT